MNSPTHVLTPPTIGRLEVPSWAWALTVLALLAVFVLLQENGTFFPALSELLHEITHDARHALGVPCH